MEVVAYIIIMVTMGAIGTICNFLDPWSETPLGFLGALASGVFAIMFILTVVVVIIVITGVEVTA